MSAPISIVSETNEGFQVSKDSLLSTLSSEKDVLNNLSTAIDDTFRDEKITDGHLSLHTVIKSFKNSFPKLSIWERFKDIFGLSNSADEQRDMMVLIVAAQCEKVKKTTGALRHQSASLAVAQELIRTGIVSSIHTAPDMAVLVAEATYRLMQRNPHFKQSLVLSDISINNIKNSNSLLMSGRLTFNINNSGFDVPLFNDNSIAFQTVADFCGEDDNLIESMKSFSKTSTMLSFFNLLSPTQQLQHHIKSLVQGEEISSLFFSDDKYCSALSSLENTRTVIIDPSIEIIEVGRNGKVISAFSGLDIIKNMHCQSLGKKKSIEDSVIYIQDTINGRNTVTESEIVQDLHRSQLGVATIIINGVPLPKNILKDMQSVAEKNYILSSLAAPDDPTILSCECYQKTRNAWYNAIRDCSDVKFKALHLSNTDINDIVDTIVFTCFQEKTSREYSSLLSKVGTHTNLEKTVGIINLDLNEDFVSITQTYSSVDDGMNRFANNNEEKEIHYRFGGVGFKISRPYCTSHTGNNAGDSNIIDIIRSSIDICGIGVHSKDKILFDGISVELFPLPI